MGKDVCAFGADNKKLKPGEFMRRSLLLVVLCFFIGGMVHAQQAASSDIILKEAYQQAAKENKNVFVIFSASWCGWCHRMDSAMNDKACKKFFDDNYIVRHLIVSESRDKKNLENPGAKELLISHHGEGQGIPFWLIFDSNGNLLADSQIRPEGASLSEKGENVGFPAKENEMDQFIAALKKTSSLSQAQLDIIEKTFKAHNPR